MVSVGHESLRGQVASAVLPWRSQCEGPVEELVGQSRLSLVVDLQARRERVRVENRVGTESCRRGVLPDPEDYPDPVPVVIKGKVGLPSDETPWNDSSVMAILLPTRAAEVEPKGGSQLCSTQVVPIEEKVAFSSKAFIFFSAWATMALLTCAAIFFVW